MTASANTPDDTNNFNGSEFNMKHRLTGAGLLISLGVVVLPWLLGSYSISADGDASVQSVSTQSVRESRVDVADNSIQINNDDDIKVFVSKIKPVDSKGRQIYEAQKASIVDKVKLDEKPLASTAEVEKVKEKLKAKLDTKETKAVSKKADIKVKSEAVAKIDKPAVASKQVETKKAVEQGYIVSVGVYLKREGADSVINDLKKKGFKPSSSESKSSKGLATRVWLGPFLTRAAAGKERSKLEQIIGEKGWIIRYP